MSSFLISNKKSDCCGCGACTQSCAHQAITLKKDEEGFLYPKINQEKCTHCQLCEIACPYTHIDKTNDATINAFYGWHLDENIRTNSSSGGYFSAIAQYILNKEGVVYGAYMDENYSIYHIGINKEADLNKLRVSKYAQSEIKDCYKEIRGLLRQEKLVYFSGTPCQVAGLKSFLRKEYKNLITTDLICHGVPSNDLFVKYIEYLEKKDQIKIVDFKFRNPQIWYNYITYEFINKWGEKKKFESQKSVLSPYFYAFIKSMANRPSCYTCPFAKTNRTGDLTLGDFWGWEKYTNVSQKEKGCSLLLVNNQKGKDIMQELKKSCFIQSCDLDFAIKYNSCLIKPSEKPNVRDEIYEKLNKYGFKNLAHNDFKHPEYNKLMFKGTLLELSKTIGIHKYYKALKTWKKK